MSRQLIIDTDPGVDDALAILYALHHPGVELLGLTAVFGNVAVELARDNARRLLHLAGVERPVRTGAAAPLRGPAPSPAAAIHGANGLGGVELALPPGPAEGGEAADFIVERVRAAPGEVVLVPIGPLSNIALALARAPDIAAKVAAVVLMGGAWREPGNVSPVAEANVHGDPHAAELVFAADWPVIMVALDATHRLLLDEAFFAELAAAAPRQGGALARCHRHYIDFYAGRHGGRRVCAGHDVLAVIAAVEPALVQLETAAVTVVGEGQAIGQTLCTPPGRYPGPPWAGRTLHRVATGVDADGARHSIRRVLARAD